MTRNRRETLVALSVLLFASAAIAQVPVTLPDTSQSTLLTANVSEQASVTVPAGITFNVTDIASATVAAAAVVDITNIVLATATKQLQVSLQAAAAAFTPPIALAATWAASDVSWNASSWTSGTGAANTLSDAAYTEVATCDADTAACDTSDLILTLAPELTVKRSGNHTLSVTWKFASIGV